MVRKRLTANKHIKKVVMYKSKSLRSQLSTFQLSTQKGYGSSEWGVIRIIIIITLTLTNTNSFSSLLTSFQSVIRGLSAFKIFLFMILCSALLRYVRYSFSPLRFPNLTVRFDFTFLKF